MSGPRRIPVTTGVWSTKARAKRPLLGIVLNSAFWQDLVDRHGFRGGYQTVKRFVRKLRGSVWPEARVIIETRLGEECQVDYGSGPMVRDPDSGKYRRTRLFVLTLGWSRKCVRLLAFRSSARVWAELHEQAFRRLGGSPRIAVLDNLREGVLSADFYDPGLNPLYRDVLAHYGVTPCRAKCAIQTEKEKWNRVWPMRKRRH